MQLLCDDAPDDEFSDLRNDLDAHEPVLSQMTRRILLLVAQVPAGEYTTFTALKDSYERNVVHDFEITHSISLA